MRADAMAALVIVLWEMFSSVVVLRSRTTRDQLLENKRDEATTAPGYFQLYMFGRIMAERIVVVMVAAFLIHH